MGIADTIDGDGHLLGHDKNVEERNVNVFK